MENKYLKFLGILIIIVLLIAGIYLTFNSSDKEDEVLNQDTSDDTRLKNLQSEAQNEGQLMTELATIMESSFNE